MRHARSHEELVGFDAEFHALVAAASGNATLASMLNGVSGRTTRARVWRAVVDDDAEARTIAQHADILGALEARDAPLAEAAALIHVATTEAWIRRVVGEEPAGPTHR
jgi:GntR family transcriptional repressor for pyruvate dehydrogenase complex